MKRQNSKDHEIVHVRDIADLVFRAANRLDLEPSPRKTPVSATPSWASFGEFLIRASVAAINPERVDPRLVRAPTGAGEIDPSGGGFLVPEVFLPKLYGIIYENAVLAPLCTRPESSLGPLAGTKLPAIDETSRQDGSRMGGTVGYWQAEGASIPPSLPKFRNLTFAAKKFIAAATVSSELFNDVPLLGAHMERAFGAEFGFKLDLAIFSGDGAGKPLGILNSPSLVTIAKETGQASQTIVAANVAKMWSRLPAPSRRRAVWLIGEDAEQQLEAMNNLAGTSATAAPTATALYMPAGANGNEFPLLKGRPVIAIEQALGLGSTGDIVLADLKHFILIDGGMKIALSMDVDFVSDQTVFRFSTRVDGQSEFASPITPYNGSGNLRSPFVALAPR